MRFAVQFARLLTVALPLAVPAALARPSLAQAAPPPPAPTATGPLKIAVANPSRIFNEMQETRALQSRMKDEQSRFVATQKEKAGQIEQIKSSRDALNPAHPQYEELNRQLMNASIEYKVWVESQRIMAEQTQKRQMRALFEKIQNTISEVAKRDGIDLVIAESKDPLPNEAELDQMNISQFKVLLLQKDVLFASDRADLSQAVLALLDARYKGAAGAPAAGAGGSAAPLINPVGANK